MDPCKDWRNEDFDEGVLLVGSVFLERSCMTHLRRYKDMTGFKEMRADKPAEREGIGWVIETCRVSRGDEGLPSTVSGWKSKKGAKLLVEYPALKFKQHLRKHRKWTILYDCGCLREDGDQ